MWNGSGTFSSLYGSLSSCISPGKEGIPGSTRLTSETMTQLGMPECYCSSASHIGPTYGHYSNDGISTLGRSRHYIVVFHQCLVYTFVCALV